MEWIHETSHRDDCTAVRAVARGDLWTPWSAAIRVELTAPDPTRAGGRDDDGLARMTDGGVCRPALRRAAGMGVQTAVEGARAAG